MNEWPPIEKVPHSDTCEGLRYSTFNERTGECKYPNAHKCDCWKSTFSPWIPVGEQLPKPDSTNILTLWDDGDVVMWSSNKLSGGKDYVTHWMPLPAPPTS